MNIVTTFIIFPLHSHPVISEPISLIINATDRVNLCRNGRLNYAKELGKYINVDIFGACGTNRCPRTSAARCFSLLDKEYKFYLAFENSNCQDYITEKFFVNGLG